MNTKGTSITLSGWTITEMTRAALFTAALAVFSQIAIPLPGGVPINLALLAVYLAAFALNRRGALTAVGLYLLLGAVGVPVFAQLRGGPAALVDKTGGYLVGYLFTAAAVAVLGTRANTFWKRAVACAVGLMCCYVPGTLWFMSQTGLSLQVSLGYCVYPFIPGDIIKIVAAASAAPRLRAALSRLR